MTEDDQHYKKIKILLQQKIFISRISDRTPVVTSIFLFCISTQVTKVKKKKEVNFANNK